MRIVSCCKCSIKWLRFPFRLGYLRLSFRGYCWGFYLTSKEWDRIEEVLDV